MCYLTFIHHMIPSPILMSSPVLMSSPTSRFSPTSPTFKGKGIRRASMPHVVTQLDPGSPNQDTLNARRTARLARASTDFPKSSSPLKRTNNAVTRASPRLTILTPEMDTWEFGCIPRIREVSNEPCTPVSAIETIFDVPSAAPSAESPHSSAHSPIIAPSAAQSVECSNSSTHSSNVIPCATPNVECSESSTHLSIITNSGPSTKTFVAELEDTSQIPPPATWPKIRKPFHPSPPPPDTMEFKTTEITVSTISLSLWTTLIV